MLDTLCGLEIGPDLSDEDFVENYFLSTIEAIGMTFNVYSGDIKDNDYEASNTMTIAKGGTGFILQLEPFHAEVKEVVVEDFTATEVLRKAANNFLGAADESQEQVALLVDILTKSSPSSLLSSSYSNAGFSRFLTLLTGFGVNQRKKIAQQEVSQDFLFLLIRSLPLNFEILKMQRDILSSLSPEQLTGNVLNYYMLLVHYSLAGDDVMKAVGAYLLEALVLKKKALGLALSFAQKSIEKLFLPGVSLLKSLAKQGVYYAEITAGACALCRSADKSMQASGVEILEILVAQGKALDEAKDLAGRIFDDSPILAVKLLKTLVLQGSAYTEALIAAQQLIVSSKWKLRGIALELFNQLLAQGQGVDRAVVSAEEALGNSSVGIKQIGLDLLKKLIGLGYGHKEAEALALDFIRSENRHTSYVGIELFKALFLKGKGVAAVQEILPSLTDDSIKRQLAQILDAIS